MKQQSALFSDGVRHGFFTRKGGVSDGIYDSLNCGIGSDDDPNRVRNNRALVAANLGVSARSLLTPYQVHSADVVIVESIVDIGTDQFQRPRADALVTHLPGLALGVVTADCVPVLLHDTANQTIAALHAGWKGTLAGIVGNTIAAIHKLGDASPDISAAIGPCIAQVSYEVGAEVFAAFIEHDPTLAAYFMASDRAEHYRFDLGGVVARMLDAAGVHNIDKIDHDTYAQESLYFSYRRATHRQQNDYGRQLSAIVLEGNRAP